MHCWSSSETISEPYVLVLLIECFLCILKLLLNGRIRSGITVSMFQQSTFQSKYPDNWKIFLYKAMLMNWDSIWIETVASHAGKKCKCTFTCILCTAKQLSCRESVRNLIVVIYTLEFSRDGTFLNYRVQFCSNGGWGIWKKSSASWD